MNIENKKELFSAPEKLKLGLKSSKKCSIDVQIGFFVSKKIGVISAY